MNEAPNNQAPADPARQADPALNPDLVGYQSTEQLAAAHRNLMADAKRRSEENLQLKAQLEQAYRPELTPRQQVPDRSRPSDRLAEFGVPVDALQAYVGEELQKAFAPIQAGLSARNEVLARYPDYNKFESDVAAFIQQDPQIQQTYQRLFTADPAGAFEYAFLKFGDSRRRTTQPDAGALEAEAASHASIPSARNGDARRIPQGNQADLERAWANYQKTGSSQAASEYAHARLRTAISDDFLNE